MNAFLATDLSIIMLRSYNYLSEADIAEDTPTINH